jgi:hypothetical protein
MFRYKDDVLSLNNFVDRIYSIEPEIKDTTDTYRSISYLDLHLKIDSEGRLWTKVYDKRDDFNIPIVNFHLYAATFQQHWHMEYISLIWYDIPERLSPIRMSLIEDATNKETTETRVPFGKVEVITSKMLRLPPWRGCPLWNICVTMTTDMFHLSEALSGPFGIHDILSGL